jgi:RNA polymerase sigma-70 factor (sigma-E family)
LTQSPRDEEFSAFVVGRRVGLLRSACLLTAGDRHLAEDLVQTALARMYVAWPKVRRSDSPDAYARRILVNAFIDETRRPRWRREQSVAELPEQPDPRPWPEAANGDMIRAALAELPRRMRAAVVLRHWLDLSVEETADLLHCSEGTVKSQTAKAISRLRGLLDDAALSGPVGTSRVGTTAAQEGNS